MKPFDFIGIQPNITMTPNSTGVVYESGRELNITCEATNTFGGTVEWMSRGEPVLDIGIHGAISAELCITITKQSVLIITKLSFACVYCIVITAGDAIVLQFMPYNVL